MKHLNVHHFVRMGTLLEREVQVKAVIEELLGALERKQGVWDSELSKTRVLTITGVKGCGKTMFMRHLAGGKAQQGFIESSRVGGKAVVVSFHEDAGIAHMKGRQGNELLRSFGVLLLAYNKVPLETAKKIASFDEAILLMRESLELSATEPLTVLVDEIIMLKDLNEGKDWQVTALVTYLKKYQDWTITGNMPVLFVFSSPEQYMEACATVSGSRVVETVNLECLSDDSATLSLLPDDVQECIKCTVPKTDGNPASSVLRSWRPRWDTTRALPAVQQVWLPPQLPLAAPRNAVNLLLLRRAAKVFG